MIRKKDILKAAKRHSESIEHVSTKDAKEGFIEGVKWAINNQ